VLSLRTEAECGFQSQISIREGIAVAKTSVTAAALKIAEEAAAIAPAVALTSALAGGSFYLYKRLTWTNKAKEIEFKRQFVAHVIKKEQLIVDSTSVNCSKQVEQ